MDRMTLKWRSIPTIHRVHYIGTVPLDGGDSEIYEITRYIFKAWHDPRRWTSDTFRINSNTHAPASKLAFHVYGIKNNG